MVCDLLWPRNRLYTQPAYTPILSIHTKPYYIYPPSSLTVLFFCFAFFTSFRCYLFVVGVVACWLLIWFLFFMRKNVCGGDPSEFKLKLVCNVSYCTSWWEQRYICDGNGWSVWSNVVFLSCQGRCTTTDPDLFLREVFAYLHVNQFLWGREVGGNLMSCSAPVGMLIFIYVALKVAERMSKWCSMLSKHMKHQGTQGQERNQGECACFARCVFQIDGEGAVGYTPGDTFWHFHITSAL